MPRPIVVKRMTYAMPRRSHIQNIQWACGRWRRLALSANFPYRDLRHNTRVERSETHQVRRMPGGLRFANPPYGPARASPPQPVGGDRGAFGQRGKLGPDDRRPHRVGLAGESGEAAIGAG